MTYNHLIYIFFISTYNKQWSDAQSALMDLLQQEMPPEPPKPERVRHQSIFYLNVIFYNTISFQLNNKMPIKMHGHQNT